MTTGDEASDTAWLRALEQELGWALRATAMGFQGLAGDTVVGIPGGARGYLVLVAASEGSAPSQLALAARLSIDKTQMTTLIDKLESEGLVQRTPDPRDRRARLVTITPSGRRRLAQARKRLQEVEHHLLAPLSPAEQEQFLSMITRVASGVTGSDDRPPV